VSESDVRIQELEARLAEFGAALGRERAERERVAHERDEYKKLYELIALELELERVKRHLRAQNKSERVDAAQVQLAFAEVAKLVVPPELAQAIADQENEEAEKPRAEPGKPRGPHGRGKIADHLPVERIALEPPESLRSCACCGKAKTKIGEETSRSFWACAWAIASRRSPCPALVRTKCCRSAMMTCSSVSVPLMTPVQSGWRSKGSRS
jgi:hypothetical protein